MSYTVFLSMKTANSLLMLLFPFVSQVGKYIELSNTKKFNQTLP